MQDRGRAYADRRPAPDALTPLLPVQTSAAPKARALRSSFHAPQMREEAKGRGRARSPGRRWAPPWLARPPRRCPAHLVRPPVASRPCSRRGPDNRPPRAPGSSSTTCSAVGCRPRVPCPAIRRVPCPATRREFVAGDGPDAADRRARTTVRPLNGGARRRPRKAWPPGALGRGHGCARAHLRTATLAIGAGVRTAAGGREEFAGATGWYA